MCRVFFFLFVMQIVIVILQHIIFVHNLVNKTYLETHLKRLKNRLVASAIVGWTFATLLLTKTKMLNIFSVNSNDITYRKCIIALWQKQNEIQIIYYNRYVFVLSIQLYVLDNNINRLN